MPVSMMSACALIIQPGILPAASGVKIYAICPAYETRPVILPPWFWMSRAAMLRITAPGR